VRHCTPHFSCTNAVYSHRLDNAKNTTCVSLSILIRFSSGLFQWARPTVLSISYYCGHSPFTL
jgi:hypothetical protein